MNVLQHYWSRSRIGAFADGELHGDRRRRMARHLDDCEVCRQALQWIRSTKASLVRVGERRSQEAGVDSLHRWIDAELTDPGTGAL